MSKKIEIRVQEGKENESEVLPEDDNRTIVPLTLEEKVLNYINVHPYGVKIPDMEEPLGELRMKLGFVAKKLLDEGRILKIDTSYFPRTSHDR